MNVLYISYDGAADNLGQSQVIPYVNGLAEKNIKFTLLTYEKITMLGNKEVTEAVKSSLSGNIDWVPLRYHKNPALILTFYDIIAGFITGFYLTRKKNITVIHGRSFIGSIVALLIKKLSGVNVILDIRGFWPEERVEAGLWPKNGWLFKIAKLVEKELILGADEVIVLTHKAKEEIKKLIGHKKIYINVVPTCVDMNRSVVNNMSVSLANNHKFNNKFIITYIGSLSTWYVPEEMFKFFNIAHELIENSFFLILTKEAKFLESVLGKMSGIKDNFFIASAEHRLVPSYLSFAKIGLAFYKPGYSRKACCPTKLGEYLAAGLPVIINAGIGDCDELVYKERVGVVINEFSVQEYKRAISEVKLLFSEGDVLKQRCRRAAEKYFSLGMGVDRYFEIYKRLT